MTELDEPGEGRANFCTIVTHTPRYASAVSREMEEKTMVMPMGYGFRLQIKQDHEMNWHIS